MEKYSRILVIIFFLCLTNLGLSIYTLSKYQNLNNEKTANTQLQNNNKPAPSPKSASPSASFDTKTSGDLSNIQSDITLIKAEIRALREILGTTKSFEELSLLIKSLEPSNE